MRTVRVSDLQKKTVQAALTWEGERIEFSFYPARFTAGLLVDLVSDAAVEPDAVLADVLASWNLVDDDGAVLPITAEVLRGLGNALLWALLRTIRRWVMPDESESNRPGYTA